jgi:hypothetical protein
LCCSISSFGVGNCEGCQEEQICQEKFDPKSTKHFEHRILIILGFENFVLSIREEQPAITDAIVDRQPTTEVVSKLSLA